MLRSFAVILVVLDHFLWSLGFHNLGPIDTAFLGLVGVYMFFVHTSLVLMWSIERKPHTLDFYVRRAFRIYPLVWTAVLFTLMLGLPLGNLTRPIRISDILSNLLLIQNLHSGGNIMGVLWSLPLEVDMYLLLPPLYFYVRKNASLWPLLIFWGVASLLARPLVANYGNAFFTDIPCFLPGVMAYIQFRRVRPIVPAWILPIFLVGLTSFCMHRPKISSSWWICLLLGLALPFFRQLTSPLLRRLSHELAKYSYGVYLGHLFALYVAFHTFASAPFIVKLMITILATSLFAWIGYHTIEKPMIRLGTRAAAFVEKRYEQQELEAVL